MLCISAPSVIISFSDTKVLFWILIVTDLLGFISMPTFSSSLLKDLINAIALFLSFTMTAVSFENAKTGYLSEFY